MTRSVEVILQNEPSEVSAVPGLAQLGRECQPPHDLWPGIAARLRPRVSEQRSPWPYALAASICLALMIGMLLRREPAAEPAGSSTVAIAEPDTANALPRWRPYGNRDGQSADVAALSPRTLRMLRSESLDDAPALVAERADGSSGLLKATYATGGLHAAHGQQAILRANLKLVAQAEREVRRALKTEPDSISLQNLLHVAQEKRAVLTALLIHEPG